MSDTLKTENTDLDRFLRAAADLGASDVHLVPGYPVTYRIHGELREESPSPLAGDEVQAMVASILPEHLVAQLQEKKSLDCSLNIENNGRPCRFRANVFLSRGDWCACLRHVPNDIPPFRWMGFPEGLAQRLVGFPNGLVIITGVTGSGKSTTLASLINIINERGGRRVITVEEPIEYVFKSKGSTVITQREVGRDVDSFYDGLRSGLRQDPDVILLGEIRDRDTAQMALSAAETGHLILTTLHTKDAKGAITRFVDLFPHQVQDDVRTQLSLSLRSVVSQHLLKPAKEGEKRVLALEVLHVSQPARIAIKFGKIEAIESAIQTGGREGMVSLDDELLRLVREKRISLDTARRFAKDGSAIR